MYVTYCDWKQSAGDVHMHYVMMHEIIARNVRFLGIVSAAASHSQFCWVSNPFCVLSKKLQLS